jgi:hypothetical protein
MGWGEREGIGRIRQVGRAAAEPVERFDPEGDKTPEGERKLETQPASQSRELQRARSRETAGTGANRNGLWSRKAERAVNPAGDDAK